VNETPAAPPLAAIEAQADLHHQYLLGLQLMVATQAGAEVVGEWMFRLFRRQHEQKFLSSFAKLGLQGLPDAVACAQYHVLSNSMGGVAVEYMYESDRKAWVRFRYPRWMYDGPTLCGVPVEASRGFLRAWYAQNGVSLQNPRLGFVCVSEDMTGQFGLCGYFREYDHVLSEAERLQFAPNERPPPYDASQQPQPPADQWDGLRLARANRNYAVEYIRNGIDALRSVVGRQRTLVLAQKAARLTGLQQCARLAMGIGVDASGDGGPREAGHFLAILFSGMGDPCELAEQADGSVRLRQSGLRVVRDLPAAERELLLACWIELWRGAVHAQRTFMDVEALVTDAHIDWHLRVSPA